MDHGRTELAILRPDALPADVHKVATDVVQGGYAGVVVSPVFVARVATMLRGSGATVTASVSYPAGTSKPTVKAIEATSCIKDGAEALLIVPHQPNVMRGDVDAMRAELLEIARAARATRRDVQLHVMIEVNDEPLIANACRAIRESACDGVVCRVDAVSKARRHAESLVVIAMADAASTAVSYDADRAIEVL